MQILGSEIKAASVRPKIDGPLLRPLSLDWSSTDKYPELRNFRMEVNNTFSNYNINKAEKSANYKILARQAKSTILRDLTKADQEACSTIEGLFETLSNKFRPQCNETINSHQYC